MIQASSFYFFFKFLFLAVLGLRFCARAFSSCSKWGHSSSRCAGPSLSRPLLLRSMGSRRAGSAIVAHGPSCSAACGVFPDQGSNPCPLHWQADSQPLRHQGSPSCSLLLELSSKLSELTKYPIYYRGILSYRLVILQGLAVEESQFLGKFFYFQMSKNRITS